MSSNGIWENFADQILVLDTLTHKFDNIILQGKNMKTKFSLCFNDVVNLFNLHIKFMNLLVSHECQLLLLKMLLQIS